MNKLSFTRLFGRVSFAQELRVQRFTSPISWLIEGNRGPKARVYTRPFARHLFTCPYQELNVEKEAEYKVVKKAFLKLAMESHPDTAGHDSEDSKKKAVEIFMKARSAFESIVELADGASGLKIDHNRQGMEADEFDSWLKSETGLNPFDLNLDADTLKEIADASASQAGLDRGGMWHMAQSLTQGINTGGPGAPLKLEQGIIREDGTKKIRRIRRR